MIDGVIAQTGNSRLVKANLPATYEEFKAQAAAGTLPIDLLFNAAGWSVQPTFLNKANLLSDTTTAKYPPGTDTVDAALAAIPNVTFQEIVRYDTAGSYTWNPPFTGTFVFLIVGAGGGGAADVGYSSSHNRATGGGSGYPKCFSCHLSEGTTDYNQTTVNIVVGAKGIGGKAKYSGATTVATAGGSSSVTINRLSETLGSVTAEGGGAGDLLHTQDDFRSSFNNGAQVGGYPDAEYGPDGLSGSSGINGYWFGIPWICINPVTGGWMLGGGAGVTTATSSSGSSTAGTPGLNPLTGKGGGTAARAENASVTAGNATEFGCGGGAAAVDDRNKNLTATGGNGADGIVIIYGIEDVDG